MIPAPLQVAAALSLALSPLAAHANHLPPPLPPGPPAATPHECVVLLHGMARTHHYMRLLQDDLRRGGYATVNENIPTRKETIEQLAQRVDGFVAQCRAGGATRIHFVTHSLGGLVVRQWLADHPLPEAGRFVMLGTPNHGSRITDRYRDAAWYRFTSGPAGQEIGTGADSLPNRLGTPPMEFGVIAGARALSAARTEIIGGPNDGKVAVESTWLPGMADHLVVDSSHYFLTHSSLVIHQVRVFLATGRFDHALTQQRAATHEPEPAFGNAKDE